MHWLQLWYVTCVYRIGKVSCCISMSGLLKIEEYPERHLSLRPRLEGLHPASSATHPWVRKDWTSQQEARFLVFKSVIYINEDDREHTGIGAIVGPRKLYHWLWIT